MIPKKLQDKLNNRETTNSLRQLATTNIGIDFSSNDYLGFSRSLDIYNKAIALLKTQNFQQNGATGSRLISGNHGLYSEVESLLCKFHKSESALVFNSGYDANLGFFSCVPQRGDIIIYDELVHASIRDGIKMSNAKAYKFKHNNLVDLKSILERRKLKDCEVYVVTESVFSMDGDSPELIKLCDTCQEFDAHVIVDEAHAVGVFGNLGQGLVQDNNLTSKVFARIITFGKALGCHGAGILGSPKLIQYLVNFSRPLIYTTALSPHSLATVYQSYVGLQETVYISKLRENIETFKSEIESHNLNDLFIESNSAIHCCIIPGNNNVKTIAKQLQKEEFDVRPILSPTVKAGKERLRFCLHAFNTQAQLKSVINSLVNNLKK